MIVAHPCHFEAPGETKSLVSSLTCCNKQSDPGSKKLWVSGQSQG